MTGSTPPPSGSPPDRCVARGGAWVAGKIAMQMVGAPRFVYRLGSTEVSTEVAADPCVSRGHVRLRARDPEMIDRARRAASLGRRTASGREG